MTPIDWARRGLELRFTAATPPIARYALRPRPRATAHDPFHRAFQPTMHAVALPAAVLPLRTRRGDPLDPTTLALPDGATRHPIEIISPEPAGPRRTAALWLQGIDEATLDAIRQAHDLPDALLITADERAVALAGPGGPPLHLHPLPRVVLEPRDQIADNTDAALSMDHLLDAFVERFASPDNTLPELRLATGYLHRHGMRRVLDLLTRDTPPERLCILFSGQTDQTTARHLTALFSAQVRDALDEVGDEDAFVTACRAAVEAGRLDVKVYTPAFLHAKLFLGWQKRDRYGRLVGSVGVVGSSNLTAPGLTPGGNLELDVTVEDKHVTTRLADWFDRRWEEAEPPEPPLLQVIESWRPPPPPQFATPGLSTLYALGRRKQLDDPRRHLAWLAKIYRDRLERITITDEPAFPPPGDTGATVTPKQEQIEGVHALAQRLVENRVAFLADSVGLGKTITAIGTAWHLRRREVIARPALVGPRKLFDQWAGDGRKIGAPDSLLDKVNRHTLERMEPDQAAEVLAPFDLLVVEEAHESLRNRGNKLWQHLRAHLHRHPGCKLLLISATPWNNSRDDIYNYLRLGLADGKSLEALYPGLGDPGVRNYLDLFSTHQAASASRAFAEIPLDAWRSLFNTFFVQRTRRLLESRGLAGDFPQRRPRPVDIDSPKIYDDFFERLGQTLGELYLAHRDPFGALLRAVNATDATDGTDGTDAIDDTPESNLHRSLLIMLYKRAESSLFALAISLAGLRRRLAALRADLDALHDHADPIEAIREWLDGVWLNLSQETLDLADESDGDEPLPGFMSPAEKSRYARLTALMARIDAAHARRAIRHLQAQLIDPHVDRIAALAETLDFDLEDREPKAQELADLAKRHADAGHKPVLIGGYADTALRMFLRLVQKMPSRRIGLALGGGRGWLYDPERHRDAPPFDAAAFAAALAAPGLTRRDALLTGAGRAVGVQRRHLIAAFAPIAQAQLALDLPPDLRGVDVLVGSEAISVGQNLQDSTALIQLDLPWNPMVIEQRIGRVDRHGGGRPDPLDPAGRAIVDVHYCWSLPAIEAEIALRDKLSEKAIGAIADTEYDELLLHELRRHIDEVRAERDARPDPQAAVDFLSAAQRELAERRTRVPDTLETGGGFIDGLRVLAGLVAAGEVDPDAAPEPFIGTGKHRGAAGHDWLVSLTAIPESKGGPRSSERLHVALRGDAGPLDPDLLAVVEGLADPTTPSTAPRVDPGEWRRRLVALDGRIQAARADLLARHNAEVERRAAEALDPGRARDPSEKLKRLMVEARDALGRGLALLARQKSRLDDLRRNAKRIQFLRDTVLQPAAAFELLVGHAEAEINAELQFVKARPTDFMLDPDRFDAGFELLAGDRWRALDDSQAPGIDAGAQMALEMDDRWTALDLKVEAACWVIP